MKKLLFSSLVMFICFASQAQSVLVPIPTDTISFEYNTLPYQIIPTAHNCWQVGQPGKIFFDEAYSLPLAIVTDTIENYPVNSSSSFVFDIPNPEGGYIMSKFFSFKHKFDTDTLQDIGYIEYSFDRGLTWYLAKDSMNMIQFFWMDNVSLTSGLAYPSLNPLSGHSDGWMYSSYGWIFGWPVEQNLDIPPDTITVKFTFSSDATQTGKEGWMIDEIIVGYIDLGGGIGDKSDQPVYFYPNPVETGAQLKSSPAFSGSVIKISDLSGKTVFTGTTDNAGTVTVTRENLAPGFYSWNMVKDGINLRSGKLIMK